MEKQYLKVYPERCYAHFFTLSVIADGNVNFCKSRFDVPETNYGNIYDSTIKEIWNSEEVKKLEQDIKPCDCTGFCRQMHVNYYVDSILNISRRMNTDFI
jgi:sulfatase maturation enzyme AslB (radical SAM superfamily)